MAQLSLFDAPEAPAAQALPPGMRYRPELISRAEELALVGKMATLPFAPFAFQQFTGKRRVASFGWRFDFTTGRAEPVEPIPAWLEPLRNKAAAFAGLAPERLAQALVTEYAPGAPIGWHRDRPLYEDVVGVSFLSPASLRLRRRAGERWARRTLTVEPRSVYLLRGEARDLWEHSIPPAESLRYSITFRSLR